MSNLDVFYELSICILDEFSAENWFDMQKYAILCCLCVFLIAYFYDIFNICECYFSCVICNFQQCWFSCNWISLLRYKYFFPAHKYNCKKLIFIWWLFNQTFFRPLCTMKNCLLLLEIAKICTHNGKLCKHF